MSLDLIGHQLAQIEISADGKACVSVEVELGLFSVTPVYVEAQLVIYKGDIVIAVSDSSSYEITLESPKAHLSHSFASEVDQVPDSYAINFRYFRPQERCVIPTPIPPEIARQSGAYLIHTPKKGLLRTEKWLSGSVTVDSIIVRNVAGKDDKLFLNLSTTKPGLAGVVLSSQSGDSEGNTVFKIFDKPQITSEEMGIHLQTDLDVVLIGFSGSEWKTTDRSDLRVIDLIQNSAVDKIYGSITAITIQKVEQVDEFGWVSPSSGSMDGPTISFYVAFDPSEEEYYLIKQGESIWSSTAESPDFDAPKYLFEYLRETLEKELGLTVDQIDELIFYLRANIADESDDIDSSNYVHQWIPDDDVGSVNAQLFFSSVNDVTHRIWVSTSENLSHQEFQIDRQGSEIRFDFELTEKEVVAWTKSQFGEIDPTLELRERKPDNFSASISQINSPPEREMKVPTVDGWYPFCTPDAQQEVEELVMSITRFECEEPDEDGDISITVDFEIKNLSEKDIGLIKYDLIIEQEGMGAVGGAVRNTEDCLLDPGEVFNGSSWLRVNQNCLDKGSSEIIVKLYARVYEKEFFKLGSIPVPSEANVATTLIEEVDSTLLDPLIIVGMIRRPDGDDDSNEDRLELKVGVLNKSDDYIEDLELRLVLIDRTGSEDDSNSDCIDTLGPKSGTYFEPGFWGKPKSKLKGAAVDVSLKVHRLVGTRVLIETRTLSG